ncbi:hypothetical protein U1Q18_046041, partial [Sarracenia purpurea var. burkii]
MWGETPLKCDVFKPIGVLNDKKGSLVHKKGGNPEYDERHDKECDLCPKAIIHSPTMEVVVVYKVMGMEMMEL